MHESEKVAQVTHALRGAVGTSTNADDLELIGEGFSSLILAAGDRVFRVPRHREAADRQAAVVSILPEFQPLLPVPIPVPIAWVPASNSLPCGAVAFERVPGVPIRSGHAGSLLSGALGHLLAALHAIRPHHLTSTVRDRSGVDSARRTEMADALPFLRSVLLPQDQERIERWWEAYSAARTASRLTPSLIHGDLWYENILVDSAHSNPGRPRLGRDGPRRPRSGFRHLAPFR